MRRAEGRWKKNNEKNRYFGVFTLAPLWQSANRNATRASAGAGLLVRRQRHKTDKTRAVAILFLCSVRDGRLTVSQQSQASRSSTFNFYTLIFTLYFKHEGDRTHSSRSVRKPNRSQGKYYKNYKNDSVRSDRLLKHGGRVRIISWYLQPVFFSTHILGFHIFDYCPDNWFNFIFVLCVSPYCVREHIIICAILFQPVFKL